MEEHAPEARHLGLRRVGLAHREGVDRVDGEGARDAGGAISTSFTSLAVIPNCARTLSTMRRSSENRLGMAIVRPRRSAGERTGPSFRTTTALPYRCPRYTILMGTPCDRRAIAIGATMNPACILFAIKASLISGKPWNIFGWKMLPSREWREM
jgi:hypothetical protein